MATTLTAEEWLNTRLSTHTTGLATIITPALLDDNKVSTQESGESGEIVPTTLAISPSPTNTTGESDNISSYVLEGVQQYPVEEMVQLLNNKAAEVTWNPGEHAFYISLVGEVYEKHNLLDKAVVSYKEACSEMEDLISLLTLTQTDTSEHRAKLAAYLNNLGLAYRNNGAFYEAEAAYKKALEVTRDNHLVTQHTLGNLGRLYTVMGQPDSLALITKQLKQIRMSETININVETSASELEKATQLWESGEYKQVASICKHAILSLDVPEKREEAVPLLIAWHTLLSKTYVYAQKFEKSRNVLQKLLQHNLRIDKAMTEEESGTPHKSLATAHTLYELSVVCGLTGDYKMGLAYTKKSFDILTQFSHDYNSARTLLGVAIYETCTCIGTPQEGDVEGHFSDALLECGEFTRGKSCLALCLLAFGFYCVQVKKINEALDNFEAALNLFCSLLSSHGIVLQLAHRIVQISVANNNLVKAKKILNNVFDMLQKSDNASTSDHVASMKTILDNINNERKIEINAHEFSGYGSFQKEMVWTIWEVEKQLLKLRLCANKNCENQETTTKKFMRYYNYK